MSEQRRFAFAVVAALAVIAAVVAGMLVLGSPASQRARRLDQRRVEDLRGAAAGVDLYWTRNARLPSSLDELPSELGSAPAPRDPVSGQPYEYAVRDDRRYQLCATFERDSSTDIDTYRPRDEFWTHPAARHCFDLEAKRVER